MQLNFNVILSTLHISMLIFQFSHTELHVFMNLAFFLEKLEVLESKLSKGALSVNLFKHILFQCNFCLVLSILSIGLVETSLLVSVCIFSNIPFNYYYRMY